MKKEQGSQEPGLGPPPLGFNLPASKFSTAEAPNRERAVFRAGRVGVAGTNMAIPPASGLKVRCEGGLEAIEGIRDPHRRAIAAFLFFARNQFFWDVNRRLGRLMMNGILLSNGFDVINVPETRRLEFNEAMTGFYDTLDAGHAMAFMASCSLDPALRVECGDSPPGTNAPPLPALAGTQWRLNPLGPVPNRACPTSRVKVAS